MEYILKKSVKEINHMLKTYDIEEIFQNVIEKENEDSKLKLAEYKEIMNILLQSSKITKKKIGLSMAKKLDKLYKEKNRIDRLYEGEKNLNCKVALDEVGRGPLAGPVVVCGVILKKNPNILFINDSKKLTEEKREELFEKLTNNKNIIYKLGLKDNKYIDENNIFKSTYKAMKEVVLDLKKENFIDEVLIDGNHIIKDLNLRQKAIIKGDQKVLSIAIASIIAKVTRDRLMNKYHEIYPQYNFKSNKGYGTKDHLKALKEFGKTPIHRDSFLKNILNS